MGVNHLDPLYPLGYQYKLLGDIIVEDKLDSSENRFNNIYSLGGDTVHHHDNVDIAKELTLHGHLVMSDPSKYFKGERVKMYHLETDTIKRRSDPNADGVSDIYVYGRLILPDVRVDDSGNIVSPGAEGYDDATPTNRNAQVSMRTLYTDRILRRGDPDEDGISVITCHGQLNFPYDGGDTVNSMASMRTIKVDRIIRNGDPNAEGISIITLHGQLNLPDV
jgi:hypothetical protein